MTVVRSRFPNQPQMNMKPQNWIPALALPLILVACDAKNNANEKMDAGAEKIAEGMREMASAAGEKTEKAVAEAKVAIDAAGEKTQAAAAEAKAKMDAAASVAKEKIDAAASDAKAATEEAKQNVREAAAPE